MKPQFLTHGSHLLLAHHKRRHTMKPLTHGTAPFLSPGPDAIFDDTIITHSYSRVVPFFVCIFSVKSPVFFRCFLVEPRRFILIIWSFQTKLLYFSPKSISGKTWIGSPEQFSFIRFPEVPGMIPNGSDHTGQARHPRNSCTFSQKMSSRLLNFWGSCDHAAGKPEP